MTNTINQGVSKKVIRLWEDWNQVGIWENCKTSIKLYADRAIVKIPYVKWQNNSGMLEWRTERYTYKALAELLEIAKQEIDDGEDYTGRVMELIAECEEEY